jgi:hypothetical protein
MARDPMSHAEALDSWRVHGELVGGHRPSETLAFASALQDIAAEPRLVTRLRRLFGR